MTATARAETVLGFDAVVLENAHLRVVVIPFLGGRVWELLDRRRQRQWIWHREGVPLAAVQPGSDYDSVWAGGWEELFPNDAPGEFEGRLLNDHGVWWTTGWSSTVAQGRAAVTLQLSATTVSPATSCTKSFRLADDSAAIEVSYRIESREKEAFHFLFKQHLPVAISPACRLSLPGGWVRVVDPAFGTRLSTQSPFQWPFTPASDDDRHDISSIPERGAAEREFVYVADLPAAWCGVDDLERDASLRMTYDPTQLPFVWLFLTYGGWRDCYTAVLEPCTNMPKDLTMARRLGQCASLQPGGVFETCLSVVVGDVSTSRRP